jgi:hypothetical protein
MREKRYLISGVVILGAITGVFLGLQLHSRSQRIARSRFIDAAHCRRIEVGMPQEEVEAILGGGPGNFATVAKVESCRTCPFPPDFRCDGCRWEWWTGDEGQIEVLFDQEGIVRFFHFSRETVTASTVKQIWVGAWHLGSD